MRNFVITILFLASIYAIADNVLADTLYDLYTDHSAKQTTVKKVPVNSNPTNYNGAYMPNYSNSVGNVNNLVKQGSQNYGEYGTVNRRTNPVRFDNPYNHLNDKYVDMSSRVESSATKYNGNAVHFKKGADGNIYGYNKYGQKVGIFRPNSNGTTSQYDLRGNKMGTVK